MANGGARPGSGRPRGKTKVVIERELLAKRITDEARGRPGRKLAREVLDDLMHTFLGLAAKHQPVAPGMAPAPGAEPDEAKFIDYAIRARDTAGMLAPFQSPKLKAIMLQSAESAPVPQAAEAGSMSKLTPQQAYRMLRDSDVIDVAPAPRKATNK